MNRPQDRQFWKRAIDELASCIKPVLEGTVSFDYARSIIRPGLDDEIQFDRGEFDRLFAMRPDRKESAEFYNRGATSESTATRLRS